MSPPVTLEVTDRIARIGLARPAEGNATDAFLARRRPRLTGTARKELRS